MATIPMSSGTRPCVMSEIHWLILRLVPSPSPAKSILSTVTCIGRPASRVARLRHAGAVCSYRPRVHGTCAELQVKRMPAANLAHGIIATYRDMHVLTHRPVRMKASSRTRSVTICQCTHPTCMRKAMYCDVPYYMQIASFIVFACHVAQSTRTLQPRRDCMLNERTEQHIGLHSVSGCCWECTCSPVFVSRYDLGLFLVAHASRLCAQRVASADSGHECGSHLQAAGSQVRWLSL
jgi:hypothetical protein